VPEKNIASPAAGEVGSWGFAIGGVGLSRGWRFIRDGRGLSEALAGFNWAAVSVCCWRWRSRNYVSPVLQMALLSRAPEDPGAARAEFRDLSRGAGDDDQPGQGRRVASRRCCLKQHNGTAAERRGARSVVAERITDFIALVMISVGGLLVFTVAASSLLIVGRGPPACWRRSC